MRKYAIQRKQTKTEMRTKKAGKRNTTIIYFQTHAKKTQESAKNINAETTQLLKKTQKKRKQKTRKIHKHKNKNQLRKDARQRKKKH